MTRQLEQLLRDMRDRRGALTPDVVLEESTPKSAPLHDRFEWDNKVAGHRYRVEQAAEIIRSVKVRVVDEPSRPLIDLRGFIHVGTGGRGGEYLPIDEVAGDEQVSAIVAAQMERDINTLSRRYASFREYRRLLVAETKRLANV